MPIARAYLRGAKFLAKTPVTLAGKLVLWSNDAAPAIPGAEDAALRARHTFIIDVDGVEHGMAVHWIDAAIAAVLMGSDCGLRVGAFWSGASRSYIDSEPLLYLPPWCHHAEALTEDAISFADAHTPVIVTLASSETYSRVGNALRLYLGAVNLADNADLVLLGFVGAIESLFSIAPQELSFRLALTLAKFLGDKASDQRRLFDDARQLYIVRSKIAHGDKIAESEESAAIQVVDNWVPLAEEFARSSLKRIFERKLVEIFNAKMRHKAFLTELFFSGA